MVNKTRRTRRGANALEFALTAPVLVAILTGLMDVSFAAVLRYAASASAQHGTRMGAGTPRDDDPEGIAIEEATAKWQGFGLSSTPTFLSFRTGTDPEMIVVRIVVDAEPLVGLMPAMGAFELTRVRRMEQQP